MFPDIFPDIFFGVSNLLYTHLFLRFRCCFPDIFPDSLTLYSFPAHFITYIYVPRYLPGYHFLISKCGRFVINDKFPHITKIYHATQHVRDSYAYLNIERIKLHRLVALAWVYNPAPNEFTCVDHIDGDRMNNHASNLRWLNAALNMQNRSSEREYKYYRGPIFSNGGVFFTSYIFRNGKEEKLGTHGSRAEATAYGKKMRELKFIEDYNAYRASDRDSAMARPPHMFLWTDTPLEISRRDPSHNSRVRKFAADRSPCIAI